MGATASSTSAFTYLHSLWGPHTIDRFATQGNAQLTRNNSRWRSPSCKAMDCLHLPDTLLILKTNRCNPPWTLYTDLVRKLRKSSPAATVIAPYWPVKQKYQLLSELSDE
jgi:hypothetical protein